MQVNLTFRAPEIEGATPTIMVEMVLGGKTPELIERDCAACYLLSGRNASFQHCWAF